MNTINCIAANVFRESVRDRVPYTLVLFAVLLIGASYLLGQLTAGQDVKIIKDLGLAATSLIGLFISVFLGVGLVAKEVERRTLYPVLAKPVTRIQFIAGKYVGLLLTLAVNVAVMTAALYVVVAWMTYVSPPAIRASWDAPGVDPRLLIAVFLIYIELLVVTALALLFSTFTSPVLSAVFTFGLYVAGHFARDLRAFDTVSQSAVAVSLTRGVSYLLPDLASFDVKTQVVHGMAVPAGYVALTVAYGAAYVAAILLAAMYIFARRDLR